METQPVTETPKKNQTPLIIAAVVIVLCCCCVVLAAVGYYSFVTIRSSSTDTLPFDGDFEIPTPEQGTEDVQIPSFDLGAGEPPTGGLGNEILINDTWQYVAAAAQGLGCDQPVGADTQIDVLQEPQNGVWVEKWTVACASGDSYPFEVEFTLDDTGATFNIKSLP